MPIPTRIMKSSAILLSGAALGGAGGYAATASGASTSHTRTHTAKSATAAARGRRLDRAVSITAIVPAGHGSFATLSIERGTLVSASSEAIVLREGTRRATYKTVTVSLPSDTVVRLSRQPSSISALSAGDRVEVLQGPRRTAVIARAPSTSVSPRSANGASE